MCFVNCLKHDVGLLEVARIMFFKDEIDALKVIDKEIVKLMLIVHLCPRLILKTMEVLEQRPEIDYASTILMKHIRWVCRSIQKTALNR